MGVYLRDNMGCMTDFGYVILDTNLLMFMTIQACTAGRLWNLRINQAGGCWAEKYLNHFLSMHGKILKTDTSSS